MIKFNNFKRMCSFYVSNIHLATMILPYLSEKIEKGEKITTFLENDMQQEMELLISKTNIRKELKDIIKRINWNKTNKNNYLEIENSIKACTEDINILVVGSKEFIDNINEYIERAINNISISINEIDAYPIIENKEQLKEILSHYTYGLNTSGEYNIEEMFGRNSLNNKREIV